MLLQGTLEYLAPEVLDQWTAQSQGREPAPCDPASADMWSMGVVLFEVYTCKNPFRVSFVIEYAHQIAEVHSIMILANFASMYCLAFVHAPSSLYSLLQAGWWRLATMQQARGIRALQQQWVCYQSPAVHNVT